MPLQQRESRVTVYIKLWHVVIPRRSPDDICSLCPFSSQRSSISSSSSPLPSSCSRRRSSRLTRSTCTPTHNLATIRPLVNSTQTLNYKAWKYWSTNIAILTRNTSFISGTTSTDKPLDSAVMAERCMSLSFLLSSRAAHTTPLHCTHPLQINQSRLVYWLAVSIDATFHISELLFHEVIISLQGLYLSTYKNFHLNITFRKLQFYKYYSNCINNILELSHQTS